MKIISTIEGTQFAQEFLTKRNIAFAYTNNNLYNVASYLPDIVLTHNTEEATIVAEEYPQVKFLCPNGQFPLYNYQMKYGFNLEDLFINKSHVIKSNIFFVNRTGEKSNLFIQKLRSLSTDLKVSGPSHGAISVGNLSHRMIVDFYKNANYCAAEDIHDILLILALGKPCITPFNFPFTYNGLNTGFTLDGCARINGQINFALNQTYHDIYAEIMEIAGYSEIAQSLLERKQNLLNEN